MNVTYDMVSTLRAEAHGHLPLIFDARGNGGGGIAPTITGDHQNRITDYTAIIVEAKNDSDTQAILRCDCDRHGNMSDP